MRRLLATAATLAILLAAVPAVTLAAGPPAAVGQYTEVLPSASGSGTPTPPTRSTQSVQIRRLSVGAAVGHAVTHTAGVDAAIAAVVAAAAGFALGRRRPYGAGAPPANASGPGTGSNAG